MRDRHRLGPWLGFAMLAPRLAGCASTSKGPESPPRMGILTEGGCYRATLLDQDSSCPGRAGEVNSDERCVRFRIDGVSSTRKTSAPLKVTVSNQSLSFNSRETQLNKRL